MTEITRVPLQPLAQGSMSKLWLGVIALAAGGAALAVVGKPPLVAVDTLKAGTGPHPGLNDIVLISYKGQLADGKVFDQADNAGMPVAGVIPGFAKALVQTQKGGKYVIHIPSQLAYGDKATGPIPANSNLTFTIEVKDFMDRAMLERQQQMMEQMIRARAGQAGAAAGHGEAMPMPMPGAPQ